MSLRDRLRSMRGATRPSVDVPPPADVAANQDVVDGTTSDTIAVPPHPQHVALHGPESLLPGRERITPHGSCFVAEWRYPLAHLHGHAALGAILETPLHHAAPLLARRRDERVRLLAADPRRLIYLDTETTGLAGGTGTYAFLIGIGRFMGDEFVVRQLFMRELHEEHAALHLLAEEMAGYEALVTYNGKAFDWPLLETRYALARRGGPHGPGDPAAHVDLLFAARRLWKARLDNCALGTVERDVLGVRRGDDVPGWLIPQLYFAYLRDHDARPLAGVFRHNALDLLSLAALLGRVASIRGAAPGESALEGDTPPCADEMLALGRCLEEGGNFEDALACYQAALHGTGLPRATLHNAIVREARLRAGALLKRLRRSAEAVAHWEALLEHGAGGGRCDIQPHEELAKYYEHEMRDFVLARSHVLRALVALDGTGARAAARERARLVHRLARLERLLTLPAQAADGARAVVGAAGVALPMKPNAI